MSGKINKVSIPSLNALFTILEQQPDSVLWIRSQDFQRQLYVNDNYQKIWHRTATELYQHPNSLNETLYPVDREAINQQLSQKQGMHLDENNIFYYRIITPEGKVKFIKDWHYLLTDTEDNMVGFAGLAQDITQTQWQREFSERQRNRSPDPKEKLHQYIFDILQNEVHIQAHAQTGKKQNNTSSTLTTNTVIFDQNQQPVSLTQREQQVMQYLQAGMSAKQTAAEIHVSTRTVEFHLNNIKTKAGCRTKLELLSRIETAVPT